MPEYRDQEQDLIFALDIGTRSIVGVVGKPVGDRFKVLDIEMAEHGKRYMLDGQIDDIERVGALARTVTARLEERLGVRLQRVAVAAAGRALRTQRGTFVLELEDEQVIDAEFISRLESGAVTAAEEALQNDEEAHQRFFLVGYTVSQYRLDNYPLSALQHHSGKKAEADVVATFLPSEVVESLYSAMRAAGLQVSSMTLEPIAAMNAAIPNELRLLNLALVDIGAGTTDIAICKDGSVVGYTMVTVAGDEITETLMRAFLVDFQTAEQLKRDLRTEGAVRYINILGMEESITAEEIIAAIQEPTERLADAIAKQIVSINGMSTSAVFLAGGGSKLTPLKAKVAKSLEMDEKRVAVAGNNFAKSAFSDHIDLDNPEYATPLGIAISAGMGLLNDSYVVMLNGEPAKLFRNGVLTLRDVLQMNGYSYGDMMGRTGQGLSVTLDGKRVVLRGEPATPAILTINGEDAPITAIVHAGDHINFVPARHGASVKRTLGELLGKDFRGEALLNNESAPLDTPLSQGDVILRLEKKAAEPVPPRARTGEVERQAPVSAPASAPTYAPAYEAEQPRISRPAPTYAEPVSAPEPAAPSYTVERQSTAATTTYMVRSAPAASVESPAPSATQESSVPTVSQNSPAPSVSVEPPVPATPVAPAAPRRTSTPSAPIQTPAASPAVSHPVRKELHILLNDAPMTLLEKENGLPYYLMDLLQYSGIDFEHLDRPVRLEVNGEETGFRYELKERDSVTICCV